MSLRNVVLLCATVVGLGFVSVPQAHAQFNLVGFTCTPESCQNNVGPTTTGSASTYVYGWCYGGQGYGDITASAAITILVPCSVPVVLETNGTGGNVGYLDDYGCLYYVGQVSATAQVVSPTTLLYTWTDVDDCQGGESASPPIFHGC